MTSNDRGLRRRRAAAVVLGIVFPVLTLSHAFGAARFAISHGRPLLAVFVGFTALVALALCAKVVLYLYRPPKSDGRSDSRWR
jgi:hypothetical protein